MSHYNFENNSIIMTKANSVVATSGFAIIEIGSTAPKKYYVRKAPPIHHFEYFRKVLQGPWKEAKEGYIKFEDVEPRVFMYLLSRQTLCSN
jgi:hypothetical protein